MMIITLSMIATVFTLRLHHTRGEEHFSMPEWMRKVFLRYLPKLLRMSSIGDAAKPAVIPDLVRQHVDRESLMKDGDTDKLSMILSEVKYLAEQARAEELANQFSDEWKYAASVFDR